MTKRKPESEFLRPSRDPGPEALRAFLIQGISHEDIAKRLGISTRTLHTYFKRNKVVPGRYARTPVKKSPTRSEIRIAVRDAQSAKDAAAKLGITEASLHALCDRHGIKRNWKVPSSQFRRSMTASTAQSKAERAGFTKMVSTDTRALIEAAVAAGQVTRCPPAFAAVSDHAKPLSEEDEEALKKHQEKMAAA